MRITYDRTIGGRVNRYRMAGAMMTLVAAAFGVFALFFIGQASSYLPLHTWISTVQNANGTSSTITTQENWSWQIPGVVNCLTCAVFAFISLGVSLMFYHLAHDASIIAHYEGSGFVPARRLSDSVRQSYIRRIKEDNVAIKRGLKEHDD